MISPYQSSNSIIVPCTFTESSRPFPALSESWKRSSSSAVFMERRLELSWLMTVLAIFNLNFCRLQYEVQVGRREDDISSRV